MRILEEFWYGNIEPTEYDTSSCKEYKKLLELICRNEEKLQATMTDEQKDLFEKYADCVQEYQTITDCLIFQNSFNTDLSFLKKEHFSAFIEKVKQLSLPQDEIEKLKERREQEITASLVKLNNDIFKSEKGLSENDRVYLVVASIMATLGDVENNVYPLTKADLKSSNERNNTDGDPRKIYQKNSTSRHILPSLPIME